MLVPRLFDFVDMVWTFRSTVVSVLRALMPASACVADFAYALMLRLAQVADLPVVSELVSACVSAWA